VALDPASGEVLGWFRAPATRPREAGRKVFAKTVDVLAFNRATPLQRLRAEAMGGKSDRI
jgi:hypothetical protein